MIKTVILQKSKMPALISLLTLADLPDVLMLQEETRSALPEAQKMFVLPQSEKYFAELLGQANGLMMGIRSEGRLVAQMALKGAMTLDEAVQTNTITRNNVYFHHAEDNESVIVAKSMAVHPEWRGNELSALMLDYAMALPTVRSSDHVFAQISVDNIRSWDLFLKHGFGIIAAAVDPVDQKARFIVQKPAMGYDVHQRASARDLCATSDFSAIMRLTSREALIGFSERNEDFKLSFFASTSQAATWHDVDIAVSA